MAKRPVETSAVAVVEAVLFDMGGVIVSGPWEGFAAYERANGLPEGLIRRINSTDPDSNAWAQMERGEIGLEEFAVAFEAEAGALGYRVDGMAIDQQLHADGVVGTVGGAGRGAGLVRRGDRVVGGGGAQTRPGVLRDGLRGAGRGAGGLCVSRRSGGEPQAGPGHGHDHHQGGRS